MDQLTPPVLREWITTLLSKPRGQQRKAKPGEETPDVVLLSPRTVTYTHAILRAALNDALRDEVPGLRRNVAELVSPPAKAPSRARPLDLESLPLILAAMEAHRWRALWLTYLALGLRKGEALGLTWPDIDLDAGLATIRQSLRRRAGQLVDGPVKTEASGATVPIPDPLVVVLSEHRPAAQGAPCRSCLERAGPRLHDGARHAARAAQRQPRMGQGLRQRRHHSDQGARPETQHGDLRVYPVELKTIQTMLRHSRLATTADLYTHVLREVQRSGSDRIGDLLTEHRVGLNAATRPRA